MAGTRSFPGLGFDPAEGEPGAVQALTVQLSVALKSISVTLPRLESAVRVTDDWQGGAGEEFSDHGDDLPMALGSGMEAMSTVTQALTSWLGTLTGNQDEADMLESRARTLRKRRDAASGEPAEAGAESDYDRLNRELEAVIAAARRLATRHRNAATKVADAIRKGADGDPFKPENDTLFVQLSDGLAKAGDTISMVTGAAAAMLASTGVGMPLAFGLTQASSATGLVGSLAAIGQQLSGSRHAPGWGPALFGLGISAAPGGGTVAAGARAAVKAGAKRSTAELKKEMRDIGKQLAGGNARELAENLKSIKDGTVREAIEKDLRTRGDNAAKKLELVGKEGLTNQEKLALGARAKQLEGMANTADSVQQALDEAGVDLPENIRRGLDAAKYGLDPTDARAGKIIEDGAKRKTDGEDPF